MSTSDLDAESRADARLAALVPQLVENRRAMSRLQAHEARLLA